MIYTTLNRIRKHNPCADRWRKLPSLDEAIDAVICASREQAK